MLLRRLRRLTLGLLARRLLYRAIGAERIVIDWDERDILEVRLMLDRHQGIISHDESPRNLPSPLDPGT